MSEEQKAAPKSAPKQQDNPLIDIIVNVILPVLILEKCSANEGKFWHLGPYVAMALALAIPLAYGIWHFIVKKKVNVFSAVGVGNVLLTGVITIYLYSNADPAIRAKAPILFGIKEAIQPLILGSLFLLTHNRKSPLFNAFIYNEGIFDHSRINKAIAANEKKTELKQLLWSSTLLFFGSFCLSAVMNLGLAHWFLSGLDPAAADWEQLYNKEVGRITKWGFLAIGGPLLIIGGFILARLIKGLKNLTGLETDRILQAR